MKLAFFNDYQLGVIRENRIVEIRSVTEGLSCHTPQELMETVITGWSQLRPAIEAAVQGAEGVPLDGVRLRPPLPRPGQFVCLAANYLEPARPERGPFNAFLKPPTSIIGPGDSVEFPPIEVKFFHFEPELALVLGRTATRVAAAEARDYVWGYVPFLDVSARGLPGGFFLGKSWHTFAPLGPALVTADEIADPNQLRVRLWVNDDLRHDFSTHEMARFVPELLEEVTQVMTLEPGDVVATGTHHHGLAPIQDGDQVRLEIEGLGPALVVQAHDPLKRTAWASS